MQADGVPPAPENEAGACAGAAAVEGSTYPLVEIKAKSYTSFTATCRFCRYLGRAAHPAVATVLKGFVLVLIALFVPFAAVAGTSAAPISAPLSRVLAASAATSDSSFILYRWDRFPSILILDTVDYHFQDRMFSRLAFFLEKRGFRGRLLSNGELEKLHGWNAHDYGPEGLASFFTEVDHERFVLNPEEETLKELALQHGIIQTVSGGFAPGTGGVLSISRSSSAIERRLLLVHESFHGVFFASPEYRSFCFQLWDSLDSAVRSFFIRFLDELGYDGSFRYLVVNEFQAYLMQQPARYAPDYFLRVAKRFAGEGSGVPQTAILDASHRLNDFLESRFGIVAGGSLDAEGGPQ